MILRPLSALSKAATVRRVGSGYTHYSTFAHKSVTQTNPRPKLALLSRCTQYPQKSFLRTKEHRFSTISNTLQHIDTAASVQSQTPSTSRLPSKWAGYWLIGSAGLVFGIVVIGGLTRLTESGLSITEWKPITGILPPLGQEQWLEEFTKYQQTPEFRQQNSRMTLSEFKFIFYMEYAHRIFGRVIGITFVLPAAYFIIRRRVTPSMRWRLVGIAGLIGFQGFLGWWMVRSGIGNDLRDQGGVARVSQYRLATHLGAAFVVYAAMMWNGLEILRQYKIQTMSQEQIGVFRRTLGASKLRLFKFGVTGLLALVMLTAISGGFVAGLDAGLIYNEFPMMGDSIIPPKQELFSPIYARTSDDLIWRNMFENPVTAQLTHRVLATTTFLSILVMHIYSSQIKQHLPKYVRNAMRTTMGLALLQVTLGISTLIYLVPIPLAAAHQAGSLALLTGTLVLAHRTSPPKLATELMAKRLPPNVNLMSRLSPAI